MGINKIILKTTTKFFNIFKKQTKNSLNKHEKLTSIPGIGTKNSTNFYQAGFLTPESIRSASDEELLNIPGVGMSFIKKLRKSDKKLKSH